MRTRIEAQIDVRVYRDEQAKVFVSYAPALDIYSQGETENHALRAIEGAIRMYLVTALEVDKIGGVLRRFEEAVSGVGPQPLGADQYINIYHDGKVVHEGGHQIKTTLMPLGKG